MDAPQFYDLPLGTSLDPVDAGFWSLNDDVSPGHSAILAIDFVSTEAKASRLIITLTLWSGKRAVHARALIYSGLEGDSVDSSFAKSQPLGLLKRKYPITFCSFDGSVAATGLITHFWSGSMTMIDTASQLFHFSINLNSTRLVGFDMILGASWLCLHKGWVGGEGPSLCLFEPVLIMGGFPGEGSTVTFPPVPSPVFSSPLCNVSPQSFLPPQVSHFSDVLYPQDPSSLPMHRLGYDMKIDLKPGSTSPCGVSYLLSPDETLELYAFIEIQLAKGNICWSTLPAVAPIVMVKV